MDHGHLPTPQAVSPAFDFLPSAQRTSRAPDPSTVPASRCFKPAARTNDASPRRKGENSQSADTNANINAKSPVTSPRRRPRTPPGSLSPPKPNWEAATAGHGHGPSVSCSPKSMAASTPPATPGTSTCSKCELKIAGQFVRALNGAFHLECFTCHDCGKPCAVKFFPVEAKPEEPRPPTGQYPLCELCYFKRLDLICYRCGTAVRSSYITALNRKYHVDHFTCSMCRTVLGPQDSYYEYNNEVYCHFHYSTLYAARCKGCDSAILKQFVETYRGGCEYQWHPDCYMTFKFWNVKLAGDADTESKSGESPADTAGNREAVCKRETFIDQLVLNIWTTLNGFEESTAAKIAIMPQFVVNRTYKQALATSAALVQRVKVLFSALDEIPGSETSLGREPKTLCRKIVAYLSLVSYDRQNKPSPPNPSNDVLGLISSLAHYLKILIRFGLSRCLSMDRESPTSEFVHTQRFLKTMATHTSPPPLLGAPIVTALTSDRCVGCAKAVEEKCVRIRDQTWHLGCFECIKCHSKIENVESSGDGPTCQECGVRGTAVLVTRLDQYIFLLNVALTRLELVLDQHDARDTTSPASISVPALNRPPAAEKMPGYSTLTLNQGFLASVSSARKLGSKKIDLAVHNAPTSQELSALRRTSELLNSKTALTLDDIRRIVSSERAREQMPNAFRHQKNRESAEATLPCLVGLDKSNARYFGELSEVEYRVVQHIGAVLLAPKVERFLSSDDLVSLVNPSATIWTKMGRALAMRKQTVFNEPLDELLERTGVDSTLGVGSYTLRVPAFVDDCITALRQKDLSVEGLFRKNGNIKRIREYMSTFEKNESGQSLEEENVIQLAALLKKFLREMPSPLMGAKLGRAWMLVDQVDGEQRATLVGLIMCVLNRANRDLLEVLMCLLNLAASFAHLDEESGSQMDAHNLATVISPNIFPCASGDPEGGGDAYLQAIEPVNILIESHLLVAKVPKEVIDVLERMPEVREKTSSKEILELVHAALASDPK